MTPEQRAAAERLADDLQRFDGAERESLRDEAAALLRELAAAPQCEPDDEYRCGGPRCDGNCCQPVQEPVAWHVCSVNSDGSLSLEFAAPWEELAHEHVNDAINEHDIDGAASWVVRPVYASPQPQQTEPSQNTHPPQQRKPLSADQIRDAVNDHAFWATSKNFIFRIARAIERAHGITGEQK